MDAEHKVCLKPGEVRQEDEDELISRMVELVVARMEPRKGRLRRGQHAKPTGCVRAEFTIRDDVPAELRHGVFEKPGKTFQAIVRFSNSSETIDPDGKGTARGMAIKLLEVEGMPAIPGTHPGCQDFLMMDHPVFPFATPAEYVQLFDLRDTPVIGDLLGVASVAVHHPRHALILAAIIGKAVASPLEITYFSASPFWLGPEESSPGNAVKYSAWPYSAGTELPRDPGRMPDDYLRQAIARHLKSGEAVFDFRVQVRKGSMPVEDVSIEWDEDESPPIPVAKLTIPAQEVDSSEGRRFAEECESRTFSPWNALAEHQPIGGINRLRRAVYEASQAKRGANPA